MRFVPIKSKESQGLLTLHRVRSLLVRQRTASVSSARGLLSELGIVAAKGICRIGALRRDMEAANEEVLPREARAALDALFEHLDALTVKLEAVDQDILAWHKSSEASQRLATAPGVWSRTNLAPPEADFAAQRVSRCPVLQTRSQTHLRSCRTSAQQTSFQGVPSPRQPGFDLQHEMQRAGCMERPLDSAGGAHQRGLGYLQWGFAACPSGVGWEKQQWRSHVTEFGALIRAPCPSGHLGGPTK